MKRQHDRVLEDGPARHVARSKLFILSTAAVALLGAGLAFAAFGSSDSPTILNTQEVESAIEQSIMDQRGKKADVACPSGVHQKEGLVFSCDAVVNAGATRFVVTEVDGSGNVHYEAP